jgi:predicted XRE-type DNA-binding protein
MSRNGGEAWVPGRGSWWLRPPLGKAPRSGAPRFKSNPRNKGRATRLALQIYRLIRGRGLKQAQAATILGIKQPHVSALMRNRAGAFSVERLMDLLTALGQDVEIVVRPTRRAHGEVSVVT